MQPHLVGYDVSLCQKSKALWGAPVRVWEAQGTCHLCRSPPGIYQAPLLAPAQPCLPGSQVRRRLTAKAIRCPSHGGRGCAGPSQPIPRLPTWLCSAPLNASLRLNPARPSPGSWEGSEDWVVRTRLAKPPRRGRDAFRGAVVPLLLSKVSLNYSEPVEPNTCGSAPSVNGPQEESHPQDKAWLPSLWPTREIPVGLPGIEEGQGPRHQPVSFFEPPGFHL